MALNDFARLAERGQDQRGRPGDRRVDDRVEPGHVARRAQHVGVVDRRQRRAHGAQIVEAGDEALGDLDQRLGRAGGQRVDRGLGAQAAHQRLAAADDLGEHDRVRLVEVAMDQALQAPGLAVERDQQLLRLPDLAQLDPGAAQGLGAVPDQEQEDQRQRRVEDGDAEDAPAHRQARAWRAAGRCARRARAPPCGRRAPGRRTPGPPMAPPQGMSRMRSTRDLIFGSVSVRS